MLAFLAKGLNYVFGKSLQRKGILFSSSLIFLKRASKRDINYFDGVRLATLELLAHEINTKNVSGSIAELGVYKGKFARFLNQYFPERTLYLLDTFKGFDTRDTQKEIKENFSGGDQDFSDTSVDQVLALMPHKEKCVPVVGYFPQSASHLNDSFALVSLDTDLYEPIYKGLQFFYPKLSKGGYILVHDFNNDYYKGTREAVVQFCTEENIGYVPIPDGCGTVIICK
jgi:O-methyltransferase